MQNFQVTHRGIHVEPLLQALNSNPDLWNQVPLRTSAPDSAHREADDIILRLPDTKISEDREYLQESLECVWWYPSAFIPVRPYIYSLLQDIDGDRIGRVVITKLSPGKQIYLHPDEGKSAEYYQRFHIAIQSAPGQEFICDGESFTAETGDVFVLDNSKPHKVINNSEIDRITMIVDLHTPYFQDIKKTV